MVNRATPDTLISFPNEQEQDSKRTTRRAVIGTFVAGAVALGGYNFLGRSNGEVSSASGGDNAGQPTSETNESAYVGDNSDDISETDSEAPVSTVTGEGLIDVYALERSENLFKGRISPEDIADALAGNTENEFIEQFFIPKADVLTNGKLDATKAANAYFARSEVFLAAGCDRESVKDYINDLSADRFVGDMAARFDMPLYRAMCGITVSMESDEYIRGTGAFIEYTAAAAASRSLFWKNAQREGGNLNQRFIVKPMGSDLVSPEPKERNGVDSYTLKASAGLTNEVSSSDEQPLRVAPITGKIKTIVDIDPKRPQAIFKRLINPQDSSDSPFDQLAGYY